MHIRSLVWHVSDPFTKRLSSVEPGSSFFPCRFRVPREPSFPPPGPVSFWFLSFSLSVFLSLHMCVSLTVSLSVYISVCLSPYFCVPVSFYLCMFFYYFLLLLGFSFLPPDLRPVSFCGRFFSLPILLCSFLCFLPSALLFLVFRHRQTPCKPLVFCPFFLGSAPNRNGKMAALVGGGHAGATQTGLEASTQNDEGARPILYSSDCFLLS